MVGICREAAVGRGVEVYNSISLRTKISRVTVKGGSMCVNVFKATVLDG